MKHYYNNSEQYGKPSDKIGGNTQSYEKKIKDYTEPKTIGGLNKSRKIKTVVDSVSNILNQFTTVLENHRWREKVEHRADQQRESRKNKRAATLTKRTV